MTNDYQKMTIKEKERANRQHGLPNRCPECDMAVPPEDVLAHMDRCEGRAPPHPNARWVSHKQARKLGASLKEISELSAAGIIRTKGEKGSRRYLMRDIAKVLQAKAMKAKNVQAKREAKQLTNTEGEHPKKRMESLTSRIGTFADNVGGFAAAGRKLDIPADTLRRAAAGEKIRKGTRILIEFSLDKVGA